VHDKRRDGAPCVVSGTGLVVKAAAGGRLAFAASGGAVDVALQLHIADGAVLYHAATILVIDDSPAIREEVAAVLSAAGHRIIEASDGADGLDKLAANPEIAVACCDMNMPNMDGLTFVEKAKQRYRDKTVPIVMLTSETRTKLCSEALKKGAVGWIVKPFQPQELLATVQNLTRRAR
jgi:two-component system chemotaxis response regulator CheY